MNRLAEQPSLYLQQHANQPVHWWPWCEEAFENAKKHNKPILLSIGYSSCHWCHVMAHQCFEDPYIAELMNKYFICIKVDKEERPDIDHIYIDAVQMITQKAGWPLNVFCLPDGRPFFGGTYFPPKDLGQNIVPWPQLLMRIAHFYQHNHEELEDNAENILKNLLYANVLSQNTHNKTVPQDALVEAASSILESYDAANGGFGKAPKFAPSMILNFLLSIKPKAFAIVEALDACITNTLQKMAFSGLYDTLGGGFFRYCVDEKWQVPHFEKMLYDNALLIEIYAKAYKEYKKPLFKTIVEDTIQWLLDNMLGENHLFYASTDADTEEGEGLYYTWTPSQVEEVLGKDLGEKFCRHYQISPAGNFQHKSSLLLPLASDFAEDAQAKSLLKKARESRVKPTIDKKYITAWNSLLASALVTASSVFDNTRWLHLAQNIVNTLWEKAHTPNGLRLFTALYPNGLSVGQTLGDYSFYAQACLSISNHLQNTEPSLSQSYLKKAITVTDYILKNFQDPHQAGFYTSPKDASLIIRKKEWLDNAMPAANSTLMHVFKNLFKLTKNTTYQDAYLDLNTAYTEFSKRAPNAIAYALEACID